MIRNVERGWAGWDPALRRMAQLVQRLAEENRALLGLLRCGWTLEEAEGVLRRGRATLQRPQPASQPDANVASEA